MRLSGLFAVVCPGLIFSAAIGSAQDVASLLLIRTGYVTEVRGPSEFALNKQVFKVDSATDFRYLNGKGGDLAEITRKAMQVGAYLEVKGEHASHSHALHAREVLLRDDEDKELGGFGVIEKVVSAGAEPIFQADGYTIRVTAKTDVSLGDGVRSLGDAGANCWMHFRGVRDAHGILVAKQVRIVSAKAWGHGGSRADLQQLPVPSGGALLDENGRLVDLKSKVKMRDAGGACGWHKVPDDAQAQERVLRVGTAVVPAYQKALADDDVTKISFRFYVVEEKSVRSELICSAGLIEVPRSALERLQNDDQLAALIADGVAFHLQRQSGWLQNKELQNAALIAGAAVAPWPVFTAGVIAEHELKKKAREERGRVALALMAEGGFDPWQAPETWRLLATKKAKPDSDVYPDQSGYQLGILNLQYRGKGDSAVVASPATF